MSWADEFPLRTWRKRDGTVLTDLKVKVGDQFEVAPFFKTKQDGPWRLIRVVNRDGYKVIVDRFGSRIPAGNDHYGRV